VRRSPSRSRLEDSFSGRRQKSLRPARAVAPTRARRRAQLVRHGEGPAARPHHLCTIRRLLPRQNRSGQGGPGRQTSGSNGRQGGSGGRVDRAGHKGGVKLIIEILFSQFLYFFLTCEFYSIHYI
jgi:hypothetical protein